MCDLHLIRDSVLNDNDRRLLLFIRAVSLNGQRVPTGVLELRIVNLLCVKYLVLTYFGTNKSHAVVTLVKTREIRFRAEFRGNARTV